MENFNDTEELKESVRLYFILKEDSIMMSRKNFEAIIEAKNMFWDIVEAYLDLYELFAIDDIDHFASFYVDMANEISRNPGYGWRVKIALLTVLACAPCHYDGWNLFQLSMPSTCSCCDNYKLVEKRWKRGGSIRPIILEW